MGVDVQIIPSRSSHIAPIAKGMRAADAAECIAMTGMTPYAALRQSFKRSQAMTALADGEPVAMFGTAPLNVLAGVGSVWMVGTDVVDQHPREFLKFSAEWRRKLFERYEVLRNAVSVDNAASIRWLKWLGAEFLMPIDVRGHEFVLFELRKPDHVR